MNKLNKININLDKRKISLKPFGLDQVIREGEELISIRLSLKFDLLQYNKKKINLLLKLMFNLYYQRKKIINKFLITLTLYSTMVVHREALLDPAETQRAKFDLPGLVCLHAESYVKTKVNPIGVE